VAEEVGRALAPIPFASTVYLASEALLLAGSAAQKEKYLTRIAAGKAIGTVALTEAPGQNDVEEVACKLEGGALFGTKVPVLDGDVADFAIVAARSDAGLSLALVDLDASGVTREPVDSIDPSRSLARIRFDGAPCELLGAEGAGEALGLRLLDRAAALLAFEQLGGAERAFELTKDFALGRYAFGRSIASFQAIKHRFADMWCELELARSNCFWAAWALENDEPDLELAGPSARIASSGAFDLTTVEMIQMHGGVGYTWEYDCHLFYRRARLLSAALGGPSAWRERLIGRIDARAAA
jgi:alkylation response protein AidB-like acyl-CoA dehydrogenase